MRTVCVRCVFATILRRFFYNLDSNCYLQFFLCVDCASFMCDWDKPQSKKELIKTFMVISNLKNSNVSFLMENQIYIHGLGFMLFTFYKKSNFNSSMAKQFLHLR